MATVAATCSKRSSFSTQLPALPTELWLDILGDASIPEAEHLWISARHASRRFRDYVERLFATTYLPQFVISLTLPRRDPTSGASQWPGTVLNAQLVMTFDNIDPHDQYATFVSPSNIKAADDVQNVEELKDEGIVPKSRLEEANAWVFIKSYMSGLTLQLPRDIEWNEQRKRWEWKLDWRKFVTRFYMAKVEARHRKRAAQGRRG